MSILISPSDNRGWGAGMRRRYRSSIRGVGTRRAMTLRTLLGLGTRRRRRSRRVSGGRVGRSMTTRIVAVRTTRTRRRRRR
ncbi:pVII [Aviadenovirus phalacrocoracidae]|uniref:PVII n=1 Tax=Aviadenovirus sp. TaxID=2217649 RepID=A0ABZ0T446_9ADEN|nr:pVII [Aviadenovirus sp.]